MHTNLIKCSYLNTSSITVKSNPILVFLKKSITMTQNLVEKYCEFITTGHLTTYFKFITLFKNYSL